MKMKFISKICTGILLVFVAGSMFSCRNSDQASDEQTSVAIKKPKPPVKEEKPKPPITAVVCAEGEYYNVHNTSCEQTPSCVGGDFNVSTLKCECSNGSFWDEVNLTCACPAGQYFNESKRICEEIVLECEEDSVPSKDKLRCEPKCVGMNFYNRETKVCQEGLPLTYGLTDVLKIMSSQKYYTFCLIDETTVGVDENNIQDLKLKIEKSVSAWIEPINDFKNKMVAVPYIVSVKNRYYCPESTNVKVFMYVHSIRAHVAGYSEIHLNPATVTYNIVLHEFGHILGMSDIYEENRLLPQEPHPVYGICKDGYHPSLSIMCDSATGKLKPADIIAVQRLYCQVWPEDPKCNYRIDLITHHRRTSLITCNHDNMTNWIDLFLRENWKSFSGVYATRFNFLQGEAIGSVSALPFESLRWDLVLNEKNKMDVDFMANRLTYEKTEDDGQVKTFTYRIFDEVGSDGKVVKGQCSLGDLYLEYKIKKLIEAKKNAD